jgi:hypothetical protein
LTISSVASFASNKRGSFPASNERFLSGGREAVVNRLKIYRVALIETASVPAWFSHETRKSSRDLPRD